MKSDELKIAVTNEEDKTLRENLIQIDLSPSLHPAMGRVPVTYEPVGLGGATGRGAEPLA